MGENYELTRFEVEIHDHGKMFRSIHLEDDLAQFNLSQTDMIFPKNSNDPFKFKFQANMSSRFHAGDKLGRRTVTITVQGEALPLPSPYDD